MPELPEVEIQRRGLASVLVGRVLEHVEILDGRLTRPYDRNAVAAELTGERVVAVDRRGKYLIVRFVSGRSLLIHLRMTGRLSTGSGDNRGLHTRAVVSLDDGSDVIYRDVRRFGTWLLLEAGEQEPYLERRLGPEPIDADFSVDELSCRLEGRRAPIKALLLDQRVVAGLWNIYADEALWRAGIHPLRPGGEVVRDELEVLHEGMRSVLEQAVRRNGSTLSDSGYLTYEGAAGSMQDEFNVYGRAGEPCPRCGSPIEKTRVAGRGTHFCPVCQR